MPKVETRLQTRARRATQVCCSATGHNHDGGGGGGYDYKPVLKKDVYLRNQFKTQGTVHQYGAAHGPNSMHYNTTSGICFAGFMENVKGVDCALKFDPDFVKLQREYAALELKLAHLVPKVDARARASVS